MIPLWKGPSIDGITQSMMNDFYQCRYRFYIKYILGYKQPQDLLNLHWGDCFHKGLEHYIKTQNYEFACIKMIEYLRENYPQRSGETFPHTLQEMLKLYDLRPYKDKEVITEEQLNHFVTHKNFKYRCRGKIDVLVPALEVTDHKCKGRISPQETRDELPVDLQMAFYAVPLNIVNYRYDLIMIPETHYQFPDMYAGENYQKFIKRVFHNGHSPYGDFPIAPKKHRWISQISYTAEPEEQQLIWDRTILPTFEAINEYYEYVTSPEFDYQNPDCYNSIFFQTPVRHFNPGSTEKYKCDFYEHLIGKKDLEEYDRATTCFPELEDET